MTTLDEALAEIARRGWALSALGMLRENAFGGKPKKYYCAVYPAFFGKEVWWDTDKDNSWSRILPRYVGHGIGYIAAIEDALKLAEDAKCLKVYAQMSKAFQGMTDAVREDTDRERENCGGFNRSEGDGDWMDRSEADVSGDQRSA